MRQAHDRPFALDLPQPTQAEAAETACALDLTKHWLHHALAQPLHRTPACRP
jgi:hypothetical protein